MGFTERKTHDIGLGPTIIFLEKRAKTGVEFTVKRSRPVSKISDECLVIAELLDHSIVRHFGVEVLVRHHPQDLPLFS
jgi:hypothetical protein